MSKGTTTSSELSLLPKTLAKEISQRLGVTAALQFSKETSSVSRKQDGSIRSKIVAKLGELQDKHKGAVIDEKGKFTNEKAKEEYVAWYLKERADAVAKQPEKDFSKWALVHLADSLKHRAEAVPA